MAKSKNGSHKFIVDHASDLPIYQQLKQYLVRRIERGALYPNNRLPGERELADQFGISRMTVRRALNELIQEDRLYTQPGKGTFVGESRKKRHMLVARGLSEDLKTSGAVTQSQVLEAAIKPAPADVAAVLKLSPGSMIIVLERLRIVDGAPFAHQTAYLPHALCPDLLSVDFTTASLYGTLRERYGLHIARADMTLEAVVLTPQERKLLQLPEPQPALVMVRVSYLPNGTPIEFIRSVYCGDKYSFTVSLKEQ